MELEKLSNDVLTSITALIGAHAIGRLWFCGNNQLNRKLGPSVRCFNLEYARTERLSSSLVWPKLLSQFLRLDDLKIAVSPPFTPYAIVLGVDFTLLSPTLRHCRLDFANAWLEVAACNASLLLASNLSLALCPRYHLFKDMFYNLETLDVTNHLQSVAVDVQKFAANAFGPSITNIRIPHLVIPPNAFKSLRDTVEDLYCSIDLELALKSADFELPKHLRRLTLANEPSAQLLPILPPTLTYLHVTVPGGMMIAEFPDLTFLPSLTYLHASGASFFTLQFTLKFVLSLPKSLIHLHFRSEFDANVASLEADPLSNPLAHLPPNLETLDGITFNDDMVMELCCFSEVALKRLPPSIRRLPRNLTLEANTISEFKVHHEQLAGATNQVTNTCLVSLLPPLLENIRCQHPLVEHIRLYPKNLTSLDISLPRFEMSFWNALSPLLLLKRLTFRSQWASLDPIFLDPADPDAIRYHESVDKLDGPILDFLNLNWASTFPTLAFGRKWSSELKDFRYISSNSYAVEGTQIFNRWLSSLPRSLQSLKLFSTAIIEPESLNYFPRTLTHLELPWVEITDKTNFASLPPLLTSLSISSRSKHLLKLKDLAHWLPKQLIHCVLPKTYACEDISSLDFSQVEAALPFLRGRVVLPPITDYGVSNSAFTMATEKFGQVWKFLPTFPSEFIL